MTIRSSGRRFDITDYEDFVVDVNDISTSKDAEWNALQGDRF